MLKKNRIGICLAGFLAGSVNGLLGAGGGMILVPLLTWFSDLEDSEIFPASVGIILPVCLISLSITLRPEKIPWKLTYLYLTGSAVGGLLAGVMGKKIPTSWLHRFLGLIVILGGIRYLC